MIENMPAQALEAEQSLIGAMFIDPAIITEVTGILSGPQDFYKTAHALIYKAITELDAKGETVDWVTVKAHLGDNIEAAGGVAYLQLVTEQTPLALGYEGYAATIREKAIMRKLSQLGSTVSTLSRSPAEHSDNIVEAIEGTLAEIATGAVTVESVDKIVDKVKARTQSLYETGEGLFWHTGSHAHDRLSLGYLPGAVDCVSSDTGGGKTWYAWNRCIDFKKLNGLNAGYVVGEMQANELIERQIVGDDLIGRMAKKEAQRSEYESALTRLEDSKEFCPEIVSPKFSLGKVLQTVKYLAAARKCRLVVIDYAQMISVPGSRSMVETAEAVFRELKEAARRHGIQLIVLSQFNKDGTRTQPLRRGISDLYGASALSWYCHRISTLTRIGRHPADSDVQSLIERARFFDPQRYKNLDALVIERVVKSRRGKPQYFTAWYGERSLTREETAKLLEKVQ